MTDICNQEQERNDQASSSDDDSVSLLCDLKAQQSTVAAEDMEISNKEEKNKVEMEKNLLRPPESGTSNCTPSASQSAPNLSWVPTKHVNKRNGQGETVLHKACRRKDLSVVKWLILAGININTEDHAGWTALHEACAVGDKAVVEELLKAGANINAKSYDATTPLHDAVGKEHYEVVKLLLQYGANPSDRNVAGVSALDIAKGDDIKELLSVHVPAGTQAPCRPPDSCQSSVEPGCSDMANAASRASGDGGGAREPGDIQLRSKASTTDSLSHAVAMTEVLKEVGRKQAEISTWPLTGQEDTVKYRAALTEIHKVLIDVLAKQQREKDSLAQKRRTVPHYFWQRLLKRQVASLASRQRTVVEILRKQSRLVEACLTTPAKLTTKAVRQEVDGVSFTASTMLSTMARDTLSCNQRQESQRPVKRVCLPRQVKWPHVPPAPRRPVNKKVIQTQAGDNSTHLSLLIQRGAIPAGSPLHLTWMGHMHVAYVLCDGSIKDSKDKRHQAPEHWVKSIMVNVPVSSKYALDNVMFRDKPLAYYLSHMEAPNVQHKAGPTTEELTAANLRRIMNIKIIHLVDEQEMLPNAVMDRYWDKMVRDDPDCDEWWNSMY